MFKSVSKIIGRAVTAAAAVMMTATGCLDSGSVIKQELDGQLLNSIADGETWKIVCYAPTSGSGCNPVGTRAIAFDRDGSAIIYFISGSSWTRGYKVQWYTQRDILYITYGDGTAARYTFGIADGLLTLRKDKSVSAASDHLTLGRSLAGFERTALPVYPVKFTAGAGGTLSVTTSDNREIKSGDSVRVGTDLTIIPKPNDGYFWSTLTVNGASIVSGATHRVADAVNIDVKFAPLSNHVSIASFPEDGGTLSVTSSGRAVKNGDTVSTGAVLTITATPSTGKGYALSTLTVNGKDFKSGSTHKVEAGVDIVATFSVTGATGHQVSITNSGGGRLTVRTSTGSEISSGEVVPAGTVLTVTATPADTSKRLSSLTWNGRPIASGAKDTVKGTVAVRAVFSTRATITSNAGGRLSVRTIGGREIYNGDLVDIGTNVTVSATPNPNYILSSLTFNDSSITSGSTRAADGNGLKVVASFRVQDGGIQDATRSVMNNFDPANIANMPQDVVARYERYLELEKQNPGHYQFSNVWIFDDPTEESRMEYPVGSGQWYASNGGIFAPDGSFYLVATPLDNKENPIRDSIASNVKIGTWREVGGQLCIEVQEAKALSDSRVNSITCSPVGMEIVNGADEMTLRLNGKEYTFGESYGIISEHDPKKAEQMLESSNW